jgi:hypothetical protein
VPRSGEIKYHFHKKIIPNKSRSEDFRVLVNNTNFDFTWAPHPHDPPYRYVFGNQWWPAEKFATVEYVVPGAVEHKYMDQPQAQLPENMIGWNTLTQYKFNFDYSWQPDPGDMPYHYVFGNQWHSAEVMPTVEWSHPAATESTPIKYVDWPRANLVSNDTLWHVPDGLDEFDLSWVPDPGAPPYIYQFGTQHQKTGGPIYTMLDATEIHYIEHPRAHKISVDPHWAIPEGIDLKSFDWTWHPDDTELPYIYQFATQHQKTGGAVYTVPGATEIKYLEHIEVKVESGSVPRIEIDHLDGNAGQIANTIKRIRYFDNYRDTLIRLAKSLLGEHEFVWVCSSICDYTDFDFTWYPEKWQQTMLHVFPSNEQKFGDTFYMHVPTFAARAEKKALLEWYSVNYVTKISVPRRAMPVIHHDFDSQADAVRTRDWAGPLALFTTTNYVDGSLATVSLWRENVKTIMPLSAGASSVIVPKTAVPYIKTQLYDYPCIDKTKRVLRDQPLDIVFISNGEKDAHANFTWLELSTKANMNSNLNRIHWSDGVTGRVAAYHAAARLSTTPWFFAVFAKLRVNQHFDWSWQPDRMQAAKHYIFHARNTINDLEYGHQGMIAYNKKLVLENAGTGLDFTLDQPHEVVPILSGEAIYYTSNWIAWRTAFREALKLRASLPDVENEYRLKVWLDVDHGAGKWSSKGAADAVEYYEEVGGDFEALKKSYEWAWLASYAFVKRSLVTD